MMRGNKGNVDRPAGRADPTRATCRVAGRRTQFLASGAREEGDDHASSIIIVRIESRQPALFFANSLYNFLA